MKCEIDPELVKTRVFVEALTIAKMGSKIDPKLVKRRRVDYRENGERDYSKIGEDDANVC